MNIQNERVNRENEHRKMEEEFGEKTRFVSFHNNRPLQHPSYIKFFLQEIKKEKNLPKC